MKTAKFWIGSTFIFFSTLCKGQSDIITTIAGNGVSAHTGDGGSALIAAIKNPTSGVFDEAGNYYFTERFANRIRKINPQGIISTIAGTGVAGYSGDGGAATAATLDNPIGIAIDFFDNLYVAEVNNNVIRKVVLSTGFISTIAGNGSALENGDGGQATAASIYSPVFLCIDYSENLVMFQKC